MNAIELEQLAVMFRVSDPNLGHVDVLKVMTEAGLAYSYGYFRGIPLHHRQKRKQWANAIAGNLERKAKLIREKHSMHEVRQRYNHAGSI